MVDQRSERKWERVEGNENAMILVIVIVHCDPTKIPVHNYNCPLWLFLQLLSTIQSKRNIDLVHASDSVLGHNSNHYLKEFILGLSATKMVEHFRVQMDSDKGEGYFEHWLLLPPLPQDDPKWSSFDVETRFLHGVTTISTIPRWPQNFFHVLSNLPIWDPCSNMFKYPAEHVKAILHNSDLPVFPLRVVLTKLPSSVYVSLQYQFQTNLWGAPKLPQVLVPNYGGGQT